MIRPIPQIALAFLLMLTGCTMLDSKPIDSETQIVEHNVILYNQTGVTIDEVRSVKGTTSEFLTSNIKPNSVATASWNTVEYLPSASEGGFGNWESPYFILVVSGQEIPITVARSAFNDMHDVREELEITYDKIAFFCADDNYYFSPQPDYLNSTENVLDIQYRYLPQVGRWLRQREGQLLFAAGLEEERILEYFPGYTGDIPRGSNTAIISCENIFFDDVRIELLEDYKTAVEIRESNEEKVFTPEDVIFISVDHARFLNFYFRYKDIHGNVIRQYVNDQFRDNNNGGIITNMLSLDDEYYSLVPVE